MMKEGARPPRPETAPEQLSEADIREQRSREISERNDHESQNEQEYESRQRFLADVRKSSLTSSQLRKVEDFVKRKTGPWSQYDGQDLRLDKVIVKGDAIELVFVMYEMAETFVTID